MEKEAKVTLRNLFEAYSRASKPTRGILRALYSGDLSATLQLNKLPRDSGWLVRYSPYNTSMPISLLKVNKGTSEICDYLEITRTKQPGNGHLVFAFDMPIDVLDDIGFFKEEKPGASGT